MLVIRHLVIFLCLCLTTRSFAEFKESAVRPSIKLNLLEDINWNNAKEREKFLPVIEALNLTLQILVDTSLTFPRPKYALAETSIGDKTYVSVGSASVVGEDEIISAHHIFKLFTLEQKRKDIVLRSFQWKLKQVDGKYHLVSEGHNDYQITGEQIGENSDMISLRLTTDFKFYGDHRMLVVPEDFKYTINQKFMALGFPNNFYATPFLTHECKILDTHVFSHDIGRGFEGACILEGGMSGGPMFILEADKKEIKQMGMVSYGTKDLVGGEDLYLNFSPKASKLYSDDHDSEWHLYLEEEEDLKPAPKPVPLPNPNPREPWDVNFP